MRPEGLEVLLGRFRAIEAGEDDREHRIQDQMMVEGLIEARIGLAISQGINTVENQFAIEDVIPVFADAGLVFHRLAFPSNQVLIKGDWEISDRLGVGHWGVHEIVVFVADMLRERDLGGPEDFGPIHRGMQGQIASIGEFAEIAPAADVALFEEIGVMDNLITVVPALPIDIIREIEIGQRNPGTDVLKQFAQGLGVDPIVAVDHLEVKALGDLEGIIDAFAMAAVWLVDTMDEGGIRRLIGIGDRPSLVRRAVIDDEDFDILPAGQ